MLIWFILCLILSSPELKPWYILLHHTLATHSLNGSNETLNGLLETLHALPEMLNDLHEMLNGLHETILARNDSCTKRLISYLTRH